ncbi:MAG TPA: hypothetical protein DCE42_18465 [Myxococcales bacterium]|nr:hypothetical protein [Deltaproteobacteria bacterium]MBU51992.1 hypothetical protein [Deltaproteobacteria bacterium]HAA56756.1 hypothetical protein [Myxococcales bacterium]|tara:strand:+ start:17989 stop:19356 length:1368 start_codon:yes stop_codon:yes gene_type:complete
MQEWFLTIYVKYGWLFSFADEFGDEPGFLDTPETKVTYTWLIITAAFAAIGFIIYRVVDLMQYLHVRNAKRPEDLESINDEIFAKKLKTKKGRWWKRFLGQSVSFGFQFGYIYGGMPLIVMVAHQYVSYSVIYVILMVIGWIINMTLSKIFSLWTPALPVQYHTPGKTWQSGLMIWQAWGMISWAGPVYFLATQGPSGWMGSVAFIWISQIIQLFVFIRHMKGKVVPYLEYEGLSDTFKENLKTYLASQGIKDSEVGVLRNSKMGPNAFATGLFGYRQIALTEELVRGYKDPSNPDFILKLDDDALEAVVSHEVGHIRGYHVLKSVCLGAFISSMTTVLVFYGFSKGGFFSPDYFNFDKATSAQIFSFFGQSMLNLMFMYPLTFLMISFTQRNEYNADTHLLETNGCKNGKAFFHQIRHIAPVANHAMWDRLNSTHPAPQVREERMKKWEDEHCS